MDNRRNLTLLLAAAVVLIIGFVILKPGSDDSTSTTAATTPAATAPAATTPAPSPATVIRIKDGQPVGGIKDINVTKGDTVRYEVVVDAPAEVHTHGYDILENAAPGKPAVFDFKADIEGVFEVELEETATQIAKLSVSP